MSDDLEQFEPAQPRRRGNPGRTLLAAGLTLLVAGGGWSACVIALWSPAPEDLAADGITLVGCFLASVVCYTLGLAALIAWKQHRR